LSLQHGGGRRVRRPRRRWHQAGAARPGWRGLVGAVAGGTRV